MAHKIKENISRSLENSAKKNERLIIYQLFPRIFTNTVADPEPWGTMERNGCGKLNDITPGVIRSIKELGVNTLWLTGVIEHATKTGFPEFGLPSDHDAVVKGEAGSPYAIKDYYDVAPSLAKDIPHRMDEFKGLIKRVHKAGMKLIIDFVPNHTAREYHSDCAPGGIEDFGANDDKTKFFSTNNNYYYLPNQKFSPTFSTKSTDKGEYFEFPAKATGNDCFSAFCGEYDWYETVKLNYGRDYGDWSEHYHPVPDTWLKMLNILRYWGSLGVDGFRCDMVFMVPLPFWHWVIPQVKSDYPGLIFIGEIYDVNQYRPFLDYGRFDYLYDKVNLYDTLVGIERHHISAARLTDCWKMVDGIGNKMLNFLENHDEVRFASDEFAANPERVVPYLIVSAMMTSGPFMIYYGQELGERGEENEGFAGHNHRTTIFDYWSIDTLRRWYDSGTCSGKKLTPHEKWLRGFYSKVLNLCNECEAIREGAFFDLMYVNLDNPKFDPHSVYSWIRYSDKEALLFVANFSKEPKNLEINIPSLAYGLASLENGEVMTADLLSGNPYTLKMEEGNPVQVRIKGSSALILKLRGEKKE